MKGSVAARFGKSATEPWGVPLRGWWVVVKRVADQLSADHVPVVAAGVAFFSFLAIFPAIAGVVLLFGLIADPELVKSQLEATRELLPNEVFQLLADQLEKVTGTTSTTLGFGLLFSLGFAVWSSNKGTTALLSAMDIAYNQPRRQGWIWPRLMSLGFTFVGLVFAVIAVGLLAAVPAAVAVLSLGELLSSVLLTLRWLVLAGIVLLALGLLYRYGPNRREARVAWITPGSVVAMIVWLVASWGFARYVANFGNYNETFGTLGAVVVLLLWLYISAYIVCLGAELNSELELHTDADTTAGPWRPKGEREAYVADNTTPAPGSEDRRRG